MDQIGSKVLAIGRENSLNKRESSNAQRVLDDHLLLSEALEAAAGMLDASPYKSQAGDSYIGVLAKVLMEYPRQVAIRCADPINGVSRDSKFLPSVAEIVAWCEKETAPLRGEVDYERRVEAQLRAREEWQSYQPSERLKEKGRAWLNRTDPVAAHMAGEDRRASAEEVERKRMEAERINRACFERECAAAGIDPAKGVSPSLLKLLKEQTNGSAGA